MDFFSGEKNNILQTFINETSLMKFLYNVSRYLCQNKSSWNETFSQTNLQRTQICIGHTNVVWAFVLVLCACFRIPDTGLIPSGGPSGDYLFISVFVFPAGAATLRILLSFAVGGLLGDVFLHLLPEAWQHDLAATKGMNT